ncbi:hypothetical protein H310_02207 [Aphanomyces invadans]|uniref:MYND-type domain-containing protein n=1 Tax=Aphanomyces invadans TaxID=157072 RepID=A0A024UN84_9STRA|nr:hypothetical protein H310_02207 [Aphanomyces invadans]ETW07769.1 hypothetical protein H310_02207 [Aphanomyces invadans]|eukprot:XP_008863862.1 hypothetical protein H310_02207 [Aphanomyces invadans]
MPSCHHCCAEDARCRCGQCKAVYFCNRDCQIQAWPTHRPECIPPAVSPSPSDSSTHVGSVTQDTPFTPSLRVSPAVVKAEPVQVNAAIDDAVDNATQEPSKKSKKKKKKSKQVHVASQESSASSSPDEHPTKAAIHLTVMPTAMVQSKSSSVSKDDWTAHDTVSKKDKKKAGKAGAANHPSKQQRSQSLPGGIMSKGRSSIVKAKSKSMIVKKGVSWGTVSAREFARCPGGGGAVPDEGTWALGLGKVIHDITLGPVETIELLKENAEKKLHNHAPPTSHHNHHNHHHKKERPAVLPGERLHRLSERERKELLMEAEDSHCHEDTVASPPKHEHSRRQRRSSSEDCDAHVFASLCLEQATEFAVIRSSRDEMCGCSCGDLVKKVSKMHVKKLVAWLHDRDVDTSAMSKSDLLQTAKSIASQEKNCATDDCECARNGVPCHQGVCSGCKDSCHNDRYTYKSDAVAQYRKAQLALWKQSNNSSAIAVC